MRLWIGILLLLTGVAVFADPSDRFKGTVNDGHDIYMTNSISIPPKIPDGTVMMIK